MLGFVADLRHRRDAGRRWRSATPAGLSGVVLYAIHSMVVMTALYLLSGMIRDAGGSFSLDDARRPLRPRAAARGIGAAALPSPSAACRPAPACGRRSPLVKASLDAGQGWLAAAILVSGLLTTVAFGRVFLLAFWRTETGAGAAAADSGRAPGQRLRGAADPACPVAGDRGFTPSRSSRRRSNAAAGLLDPSRYVDAVFPGSGAMRNGLGIILLTVAWLALTGSLTIPNALLGLVLSAIGVVVRARAEAAQRNRRSARCASSGWPRCSPGSWRSPAIASPGWC